MIAAVPVGGNICLGFHTFTTVRRHQIYQILTMPQEETLEIEYFESVMPPQKMTSLPHEDWISSVSCQLSE